METISGPTLHLHTVPADDRPVYIAGSFNNWEPGQAAFRMEKHASGMYRFTFPAVPAPGVIEYKYTRGGWDQEELDENGLPAGNRRLKAGQKEAQDHVPDWALNGRPLSRVLEPVTEVFSEAFPIPGLRRKRRITVLLPHHYHSRPKMRFPVLYLMDGQNLYGAGSAFGSWRIDRQLGRLALEGRADLIVVAVDHGEVFRLRELSPYDNRKWGKGQGGKFLEFLTDKLKPAIDAHYRTLPARAHTGIGGSSMGGMFAMYAGLMQPDVFGKLLIFSPSLWVSGQLFQDVSRFLRVAPSRLYLYAGGREGVRTIPDLRHMERLIREKDRDGAIVIRVSVDPKGQHREERWGNEFFRAVTWLYYPE